MVQNYILGCVRHILRSQLPFFLQKEENPIFFGFVKGVLWPGMQERKHRKQLGGYFWLGL